MVKTKEQKENKAEVTGNDITVISLGGSIIFPHHPEEGRDLNVPFLIEFREFIMAQVEKGRRFIIVVGGGKGARMYQKSARLILGDKKDDTDLDWLGIEVTKLNAMFVAVAFKEIAWPKILDHIPGDEEVKAFLKSDKKVLSVSGWLPGWSTDYDAVQCAKIFGVKEVIIAGDSQYVCDKDPRKFPDAKPIKDITWDDYQKLIPSEWRPGLSTPVDPPATRIAKELNIVAKMIKGTNLDDFRKAIEGEPFDGSTIHGK